MTVVTLPNFFVAFCIVLLVFISLPLYCPQCVSRILGWLDEKIADMERELNQKPKFDEDKVEAKSRWLGFK